MTKTYDQAYELMEKLPSNHHQIAYKRTGRKPTLEIFQMDAFNFISAQLPALSKQVQSLEVQSQASA